MSIAVEPDITDVLAMADEVWSSFLGGSQPLLPGPPIDPSLPLVSAAVTVSGEWNGVVSIELTQDAAEAVATAMLGAEAGAGDVADAVGELVNMVGGSVKSLMPGPSVLSLPVVAGGRLSWGTDTTESCRADLAWGEHPVALSVHVVRH